MGSTSSMEPRVIRVAIPRFRKARAEAGRMRCRIASNVAPGLPARRASRTEKWRGWANVGLLEKVPVDGSPRAGPIAMAATTPPRYVGVAHPLRYRVRTRWSTHRPEFDAAATPSGIPMITIIISAARTSSRVSGNALAIEVRTGVPAKTVEGGFFPQFPDSRLER